MYKDHQLFVYEDMNENNLHRLLGMRFMVLINEPYPHGNIFAYGRTAEKALKKAKKRIDKEGGVYKYNKRPVTDLPDADQA